MMEIEKRLLGHSVHKMITIPTSYPDCPYLSLIKKTVKYPKENGASFNTTLALLSQFYPILIN
jgi:hypothetical protein